MNKPTMREPQIITTAKGERLVVLSESEFEDRVGRAEMGSDILAYARPRGGLRPARMS